jgi:hypothetical protein
LLIWLILQLLTILIPITQLPLSDKFPRPAERLAIDEMLIAQISLSALLFPILFTSASNSLIVIASSWPFILLAGVLSVTPQARVLAAGTYLTVWLLVLALWSSVLSSRRAQLVGCTLAGGISIGLALLWYLQVEFISHQPNPAQDTFFIGGPIKDVLGLLRGEEFTANSWLLIGSLLFASVLAAGFCLLRSRRHSLTPGYPPDIHN